MHVPAIPELVVPIRISLIEGYLLLTRTLLNQGFLLVKLKSSLDRYEISVSQMTTDMFHLS
jgi:hypothetical protein